MLTRERTGEPLFFIAFIILPLFTALLSSGNEQNHVEGTVFTYSDCKMINIYTLKPLGLAEVLRQRMFLLKIKKKYKNGKPIGMEHDEIFANYSRPTHALTQ